MLDGQQAVDEAISTAPAGSDSAAAPYPVRARRPPAGAPARHKLALLTWAAAYVTITLILGVLGPVMTRWPLLVRTFVISGLMVVALTWIAMPLLTRLFRNWLTSAASR